MLDERRYHLNETLNNNYELDKIFLLTHKHLRFGVTKNTKPLHLKHKK